MKILLVNKFLHPKGGAETYVLQLGKMLEEMGHEVQYFGMEHPDRILGNRAEAYTRNMDFHKDPWRKKLGYGFRVIYSREARKKLRLVLEDFQPDVCHLNNYHYQLTPSILLELRRWRRKHPCRVVCTAHDYQLICPNHMCFCRGAVCDKCLEGHFWSCVRGRCIHGSLLKSLAGAVEGYFWHGSRAYDALDTVICCSHFLKEKLDRDPRFRKKTVVMHNFVRPGSGETGEKKDYVLYFGRYDGEKGIRQLVRAARELPQIPFVFAGSGPLESLLAEAGNIRNVGFLQGSELSRLVAEARFTVCPSIWWENCPFSVLESLNAGTFVLGANLGGIPELIRPGENGCLFAPGELTEKVRCLWENREKLQGFSSDFDGVERYCEKLLALYEKKRVLYMTNIPAPYRVRFFEELGKQCRLTVAYERKTAANREKNWIKPEGLGFHQRFFGSIPMGNEGGLTLKMAREALEGYDAVVVGCYNCPGQMLAILALRLWKKPYLLNFDGEPFLIPGAWKTPVKRFFLRGAAGYLAGGERAAESLRSVVDQPVIPYYFSSLSEQELQEHGLAVRQRENTVLVAAQYLPCKGLDVALEAARREKSICWHFVGMGSHSGAFLRDHRGKIPENVKIIPFLSREELNEAYQSCRVMVLPSRQECWGLVIQEAASFGTPVVSTWGSGAAVEFLGKDYPCFLAAPGDPESLYRCVRRVLEGDSRDYSAFLREKARNYSIEKSVQAHMRAFQEILW